MNIKKTRKMVHNLAVRIPEEIFEKFKAKCEQDYKTMSDTMRDWVRDYIKDFKPNDNN
jgi:metal-responsive CopG/Arc/MetJ family transcriptional regulator